MHPSIHSFLQARYTYVYRSSPDFIRNREDACHYGLNCGTLVHLLVHEIFDCEFPPRLMCLEMSYDKDYLEQVEEPYNWQLGDILFFTSVENAICLDEYRPHFTIDGRLTDWQSHPPLHLGLCTDQKLGDEPFIIHASPIDRGPSLWPLGRFQKIRQYEVLYCVRRLRPQYRKAFEQ